MAGKRKKSAATKERERAFREGVGTRLRITRELLNPSRVAFMKTLKLQLADNTFGGYETGRTLLDPQVAAAIWRLYGVSLHWLYCDDLTTLYPQDLRERVQAELDKLKNHTV